MSRSVRACVAIAVSSLLFGCGPSAEDAATNAGDATGAGRPAQTASGDPCRLVTAEEVGSIFGAEIVSTEASGNECTYASEDAAAGSFTVLVDQDDAAGHMATARQAAGVLKDLGGSAEAEGGAAGADLNTVLSETGGMEGIGDEVLLSQNSQISVRKGGTYIEVTPPIMRSRMGPGNPMLSSEDRRKMAVEVARKAVSRIP